jgi:hypothetical protein
VVGGTYRFALRRIGDRWWIMALTLGTRWQTGDGTLLQQAAARPVGTSTADAHPAS